jgi:DNA-binding CsgD family transcriptional regulator
MTSTPEHPTIGELPDAVAAALSDQERQLVSWLQSAELGADEIARRLMIDADRDHSG